MKKLIIFSLVSLFFFNAQVVLSQNDFTFHAIWACDTDDKKIGKHLEADNKNLKLTFNEIQNFLEAKFNLTSLNGSRFKGNNVLNAIQNSVVKPNDVLIIIISDHCFYDKSNGIQCHKFPDKKINSDKIIKEAKLKKARFTIVIQDCCNFPLSKGKVGKAISYSKKKKLNKIFKDASGFITINSCKIGEHSFSDDQGSFLIKNFLGALDKYLSNSIEYENPWLTVLEETAKRVAIDALDILQVQTVEYQGADKIIYKKNVNSKD